MTQSYRTLSAFEQVALQRRNISLEARIKELESIQDEGHKQIADYWEGTKPHTIVDSDEAMKVFDTREDDLVYLFLIVSIVSFITGFVASYYHYV